ncbi:MAG: SUF system Fe-S cluster assembly regulator [Xanthomonadales bacterium]|nr:SUF system Fe-S cluster assembly regulator [Xanthomonadales bacterium]
MLKVSKLSDYATVLMVRLAAEPQRVQSAAELAEAARLEPPTVAKVLKLLATAGLVDSFRGAAGGYRLALPVAQISIVQIIEAIEGPIGMTECSRREGQCSHESHCDVRAPWQRISGAVVQSLSQIRLADMLAETPARPPPSDIAIQIHA